jgi:putative transposase
MALSKWLMPTGLRSLEDENRRLKKLLAEAMLDSVALQDSRKKRLEPAVRHLAVKRLIEQHGLSQRRACRLVEIDSFDTAVSEPAAT